MKSFATKLGLILSAYGGWGILATSLLDSTFVPMPGFNDLLLLHLSSQRPALALVYALQCTVGSLLGCYVMYGLGRGGGSLFRKRRVAGTDVAEPNDRSTSARPTASALSLEQESNSVQLAASPASSTRLWLERNDFVSVLVMSLLPPPAPFKVFVTTAGVLRMNPLRFGLALFVGRGARFAAEAMLGARYGADAEVYIRHHVGRASMIAIVIIVLCTLAYRRLLRPR